MALKFFKCTVPKKILKTCYGKKVVHELKKCAEVKITKCPPKYHDCCKPKCYDGGYGQPS